MTLFVLIAGALLGFWVVYKFMPTASGGPDLPTGPRRPWYQVLDLTPDAGPVEVRARYEAMMEGLGEPSVNQLEPHLRDEARRMRAEVEAAWLDYRTRD